jgi:hypothetical protein
VIVNDLNFFGSVSRPHETDAKLIIDPNAMLARTISCKRFQSVSWWHPEILKRSGSIEHRKLAHGDCLDIDEAFDAVAIEETFCVGARKRYDGHERYYRRTLVL